jgi:hypothetical protein
MLGAEGDKKHIIKIINYKALLVAEKSPTFGTIF